MKRFGETDRRYPAETAVIWKALKVLWERGGLRPTVFDLEYRGLESVVLAMNDLSDRRVWGKAVVTVDADLGKLKL